MPRIWVPRHSRGCWCLVNFIYLKCQGIKNKSFILRDPNSSIRVGQLLCKNISPCSGSWWTSRSISAKGMVWANPGAGTGTWRWWAWGCPERSHFKKWLDLYTLETWRGWRRGSVVLGWIYLFQSSVSNNIHILWRWAVTPISVVIPTTTGWKVFHSIEMDNKESYHRRNGHLVLA